MNQLLSSWLTSLSLSVDQHSCFSMATCWRSLYHLFSLQFSCTSWSYYSHDSLLNYKENMYRRFVFRNHWNSRPVQRYCQMRAQRLKTKPWIITTGGVVHLQVFPLFFFPFFYCSETCFGQWCLVKCTSVWRSSLNSGALLLPETGCSKATTVK